MIKIYFFYEKQSHVKYFVRNDKHNVNCNRPRIIRKTCADLIDSNMVKKIISSDNSNMIPLNKKIKKKMI